MKPARLAPRFWRHDAYTLNRLVEGVASVARSLKADSSSFAPLKSGGVVVDLGAGTAPYKRLFESSTIRYIACDIDEGAQVPIRSGVPVALDDASADVVVSFQVLEHVWDLDWYLSEAHRILKSNGALVLSTHGTWLYHPHPTDYRRWTREGLIGELETRGFNVDEIFGLVGPLAWTTQFRALGYHRLLSAVPLFGAISAALVSCFMHGRMWLEDKLTPSEWVQSNAAIYLLVATKASVEP